MHLASQKQEPVFSGQATLIAWGTLNESEMTLDQTKLYLDLLQESQSIPTEWIEEFRIAKDWPVTSLLYRVF